VSLLSVHARVAQYGQIVEELNGKVESLTAQLAEARAVATSESYLKFLAQEEALANGDTMDSPASIPRPPPSSLIHLLQPDQDLDHVEATEQDLTDGEVALADRRNIERTYWEAMGAVRETDWKVKAREIRLDSAYKVDSKDPAIIKVIYVLNI